MPILGRKNNCPECDSSEYEFNYHKDPFTKKEVYIYKCVICNHSWQESWFIH